MKLSEPPSPVLVIEPLSLDAVERGSGGFGVFDSISPVRLLERRDDSKTLIAVAETGNTAVLWGT